MTNDDAKLCPSNILECPKLCYLNYWFSRFVVEARREHGDPYPATTLSNLLLRLYRHCREYDAACLNFMRAVWTSWELCFSYNIKVFCLRVAKNSGTSNLHNSCILPVQIVTHVKNGLKLHENCVNFMRAVVFLCCKSLLFGRWRRTVQLQTFTIPAFFQSRLLHVKNGSKNKCGINTE